MGSVKPVLSAFPSDDLSECASLEGVLHQGRSPQTGSPKRHSLMNVCVMRGEGRQITRVVSHDIHQEQGTKDEKNASG